MKVDIDKAREAYKKITDAYDEVHKARSYFYTNFSGMFCDQCGETEPKHGFCPLCHSPSVSGITCNKCCLTDEEYLKLFGEPK